MTDCKNVDVIRIQGTQSVNEGKQSKLPRNQNNEMRLSESPSTRSDINSASRAIRVSCQGTGWDAGEKGI